MMDALNKYKKGDWVRAKDAYVAEHWNAYWAADSGVTADRDTVFKVYDVFAADDTITIGAAKAERGPTWAASRFEPWKPKVGERVRVARHVNSYGRPIHMDLPIGSIHTVTRVGDALGNKDRPSFTLSGGGVNFYLVENLEPVTDPLPVAEQPAALTIQAGRFYKTRDGQKVGPMRTSTRTDWSFMGRAEGEAEAWYKADGTCPYIPQDDLVAEWADTPVTQRVRDITAATVDAINDEYGPGVAVADAPKFRVGDRVQSLLTGNFLTITGVEQAPCSGKLVYTAKGEKLACGRFIEEHIRLAPTPAIVCKIDNGQPLPATRPAVHATVESADAEARRLASVHKGQEFGVFVLTGDTHKEAKVYEHEWQRLAAEGRRPLAVSSLVRSAGIPQGHAERIVGQFAA